VSAAGRFRDGSGVGAPLISAPSFAALPAGLPAGDAAGGLSACSAPMVPAPSAPSLTAQTPFRDLYDANVAFVWRALRRLGVSEGDTPDAVQEVFLVAHRRQADFEGRSNATTWLFGIAFRVASDRRKRADNRRQVLDDQAIDAAADDNADGRNLDDRLHAQSVLERVLATLPLEQRAVFVLFELEEHTSSEIAEAMGSPLGTVHSRLRLAREAFQTAAERLVRPKSNPLRRKASR